MDKIIIKEACFLCNVGVPDKERRKKQKILVDLEIHIDSKTAFSSDDLGKTIDYSKVYMSIKQIAEGFEYNLIEAMAEKIAGKILRDFDVSKISITVKKPRPKNMDVKYAAVEIFREKKMTQSQNKYS